MRTITLNSNVERGSKAQTVKEVAPADWLLVNGRIIHKSLCEGRNLFEMARGMGISSKLAALAVTFIHSPDEFKFRALAEVKGMVQIRDELIELFTAEMA